MTHLSSYTGLWASPQLISATPLYCCWVQKSSSWLINIEFVTHWYWVRESLNVWRDSSNVRRDSSILSSWLIQRVTWLTWEVPVGESTPCACATPLCWVRDSLNVWRDSFQWAHSLCASPQLISATPVCWVRDSLNMWRDSLQQAHSLWARTHVEFVTHL